LFELKKTKIPIKKIASFLKSNYTGPNFDITSASSLDNIKNNSILFYSKMSDQNFKLKDTVRYDLKKIKNYKNILLICDIETKKLLKNIPVLISKNPRLDFSRVMMKFFVTDEFKPGIHPSAIIEKKSKIGNNVYIGPHCYIGNNVELGNNVKILSNTSIFGKTKIGQGSVIQSNTTIGSEGFGFIFDGTNSNHFPHVGSIIIGNNVWIGSNSTIDKAALDSTVIADDVKIDTLVNIGHNTSIGKSTWISANSTICGRAKIGKNCLIAPNSVIDVGVQLGDNCLVGSSSLVRKNFPKNLILIGSPAKILRKNN
jgi:UDP-3-O-[3-hydroxymyristoyl] glucosamine N-acyltransferase|tara:strand:+ start:122 stop:1060 length:939 start_codon:yes stop_codon:yes gene_type:complete